MDLCGRPNSDVVFNLRNDAKDKYKLAVRQVIRQYEGEFSDELYDHLLSKYMNNFWKVWSSKTFNKLLNVARTNGEVDHHKVAAIFRHIK